MSDLMRPIPFRDLMEWILRERRNHNTVFGVRKGYAAKPSHALNFLGEKIETPFGPAAGPHTQLSQNIIAAYYGGNRFFELKTVQTIDGEDLPVSKPCILAEDECYNVEWSTELTVPDAMREYMKGWLACKIMAIEFGLGDPDGFIFNMSVGYDLEGIKSNKINSYIETLKDAANDPDYQSYIADALAMVDQFERVTADDIRGFNSKVCRSITLSTLHGCPPDEIERISQYLLEEKHLHTFVKCNPTMLGYDYARKTLNGLGYDYIEFDDHHYKADLQFDDAVPMFKRLLKVAADHQLNFGVKITNTCPVDNRLPELPGEEMYMSGRSLYPLSLSLAVKLSKTFNGQLRISYSGGIDVYSVEKLYDTGVWPITMATTYLKVGGYGRAVQMADLFSDKPYGDFTGIDVAALEALLADCKAGSYYRKPVKPLPRRKMDTHVPLINCYVAPCEDGCPIKQDIPKYLNLAAEGDYEGSLKVILDKNPLPYMTGMLCNHKCMDKCTRNFYEKPLQIRSVKLQSAQAAFDKVKPTILPAATKLAGKTAVIGGGPAGIAAAHLLARAGKSVTVFERRAELGGVVKYIIPEFRKNGNEIYKDIELLEQLGVELRCSTEVTNLAEIKAMGYDSIIVAIGAWLPARISIENAQVMDTFDFLSEFRRTGGDMSLGEHPVIIGAGNTAMDVARSAKRCKGAKTSSIIYRRTKRYMPADEFEMVEALEEGVEMRELLAPKRYQDGQLICRKIKLGDYDASGRRQPIETDEEVKVPATTIIAAVGQKTDSKFYDDNGIKTNAKGMPEVDNQFMTSVDGVYAVGDALFGPSVIVKAIANATVAANAIVGRSVVGEIVHDKPVQGLYDMRGDLTFPIKEADGERCLSCNVVCENCADVCPNRANVVVHVGGYAMGQIVHVDYMCNECGNCATFCPYDSAPYLDKLTLYKDQHDFEDSKNEGFYFSGDQTVLRLDQKVYKFNGQGCSEVPTEILDLIAAVKHQYSFLVR